MDKVHALQNLTENKSGLCFFKNAMPNVSIVTNESYQEMKNKLLQHWQELPLNISHSKVKIWPGKKCKPRLSKHISHVMLLLLVALIILILYHKSNSKILDLYLDMLTHFWSLLTPMEITLLKLEIHGEAGFGKEIGHLSPTSGIRSWGINLTTTSALTMDHSTWACRTFWNTLAHLSFVKLTQSICIPVWSYLSVGISQIMWEWKCLKVVDTYCHFTRRMKEKWR